MQNKVLTTGIYTLLDSICIIICCRQFLKHTILMLTTNIDNSNNSNTTNDKLNIYLHITGKAVKLIKNSKMNRRLIGEVNNN